MSIDKIINEVPPLLDFHEYYEMLENKNKDDFCIGQIVSALISYPIKDDLKVLLPYKTDPTGQEKTTYILENLVYSEIQKLNHRPCFDIQLENDECLIVQRGKIRPCIILNRYLSRFDNSKYDDDIFICVPIYSFKNRHDDKYLLDIYALDIPSEFFLPADSNGIHEHSAVRFSRLLPIYKKNIEILKCAKNSKPFKLSSKAYGLLSYHLANYFSFDYKIADQYITPQLNNWREMLNEGISMK